MEIAKGTKILRKSELYTDIDISGKNINSQRTGVKKRKRETEREVICNCRQRLSNIPKSLQEKKIKKNIF